MVRKSRRPNKVALCREELPSKLLAAGYDARRTPGKPAAATYCRSVSKRVSFDRTLPLTIYKTGLRLSCS
jgi:hypothetical protein